MAAGVDDEVDRLYGLPLREFVAARNELAKRLRAEGRPEDAARVAALAKPPVPVWAVNQLARRQRRDVDLLLDAGHRLREAQAQRDPEEARRAFARAREAEREAVGRLRAQTEALLQEEAGRATAATVERVLATLRAAAVTEEGRELLARGRLTEELETTGFELAAALVPKHATKPAASPDRVAGARASLDEARSQLRAAEGRARAAARRVREARSALEGAEREEAGARAGVDEAARKVAAAEAELKRAQRGR